jgi:hypothetical protein
MNSKILFVAIAIVAAFGTAASAIGLATLSPVAAQDNMTMMMDENMTGMGNMTGSNMTGGNMTLG